MSNYKDLLKDPRQNKGWWFLFAGLLIISSQIMGIGGIIGAVIMFSGFYKTIKNPFYSNIKKILFSSLYTILGIIVALIISVVLFSVFKIGKLHYAWFNVSNIERGYKTLETYENFENIKMGISTLSYPADWIKKNVGTDGYEVAFMSPDQKRAIDITVLSVPKGSTVNIKEIVSTLADQFANNTKIHFDPSTVHVINVNGKENLVFDVSVDLGEGQILQKRIVIIPTAKFDNRQYIQIVLESQKDTFLQDTKILDTTLQSLRLYK